MVRRTRGLVTGDDCDAQQDDCVYKGDSDTNEVGYTRKKLKYMGHYSRTPPLSRLQRIASCTDGSDLEIVLVKFTCLPLRRIIPTQKMQTSSFPAGTRQRISTSTLNRPGNRPIEMQSSKSSGFVTMSTSWASTRAMSSVEIGPDRPPLAWAGLRHQIHQEREERDVALSGVRDTGILADREKGPC
jgi:hypothetical protein